MEIRGKTALVTGASSGIGRAIALDLARRGARVAVCARRLDKLEEAAKECRTHGVELRAYRCDVRERDEIFATVAAAARDLGPIDVLVNNAGASVYHLFTESTEEEFEEMMRTNFFSSVHFTRAALPSMLERKTGAIVFISSFAGRMATWRHTAYAASKFAMTGFAEALYLEVKSKGVHVGVIYPGVIRTELFEKGEGFQHFRHVVETQMKGTAVVSDAFAKMIDKERF